MCWSWSLDGRTTTTTTAATTTINNSNSNNNNNNNRKKRERGGRTYLLIGLPKIRPYGKEGDPRRRKRREQRLVVVHEIRQGHAKVSGSDVLGLELLAVRHKVRAVVQKRHDAVAQVRPQQLQAVGALVHQLDLREAERPGEPRLAHALRVGAPKHGDQRQAGRLFFLAL